MMAQVSKDELSFVKEVLDQIEIECPVCLHILTDPHQVSCCGRNFCKSCIERIKDGNGSCPMCKEETYQYFADKNVSRIINCLQVYCTNKEKGCQWKGDLKYLPTHLSKGKREGECQYEEVKCKYDECLTRNQRQHLNVHEEEWCDQRPYLCQHCYAEGIYLSITFSHIAVCPKYPTKCPNDCTSSVIPRDSVPDHLTQCPLEPVDCVFSWAGCNDKPLRKDVHVHTADTKHMTLLAVACGQLKKENEQIKEENEKIKEEMMKEIEKIKEKTAKEIENLKEENEITEVVHARILSCLRVINYDSHPTLPVTVNDYGDPVHFYTELNDHHMSAVFLHPKLYLAFHDGKFDKVSAFSQPKILVKYGSDHAQSVQINLYRKVNDNYLTQTVMEPSEIQDDELTSIHIIVDASSIDITLTFANEITVTAPRVVPKSYLARKRLPSFVKK
uniref:RING-type domain-containing protein n=1 Tax=Amphimedon queenslandica TaxID=400682 RepID=A0A1X7T8K2_AMPQE